MKPALLIPAVAAVLLAASPALAAWRPWLRDLRVWLPHQLPDEMEKLLHEKEVTGRAAWNRLCGMAAPIGRPIDL